MKPTQVLLESLQQPTSAITYRLRVALREMYPEHTLFETEDSDFYLPPFARAGLCELEVHNDCAQAFGYEYNHEKGCFYQRECHNWYRIGWEGHEFEVALVSYNEAYRTHKAHFIITPQQEVAQKFFLAVTQWNAEAREEVWVFNEACWSKSKELYRSIQSANLNNLVLPGGLKEEIHKDLTQFLSSRDMYERYGVPWKRGVLFVGSPGNGKTHSIKALVNDLKIPTLYVKSFQAQHSTDQANIAKVFKRARTMTPCLLVLEDLDSLLTAKNRSFFLNELDGFAANTGIITLATTNHPDRLDPAIVDRPSRFDRKYHFELPALTERLTFIELWVSNWEPEMRPTEEGLEAVAMATDGFSFAYLKETLVSALMRWINLPQGSGMDAVLVEQCHLLRGQMSSMAEQSESPPSDGMGQRGPWSWMQKEEE